MRVLHLGKYFPPYPGGIEVFTKELASQQQEAGVRPAVLVHAPPGQRSPDYDAEFPLYCAATWSTLAYAPVSPGFGGLLRRALREFDPDILHFHLPNVSAFWALTSGLARRIPWVAHWHSDVLTDDSPWQIKVSYSLYRRFEQALLQRCKVIVATSDNYRDASPVLQRFVSQTAVVPLGLNPDSYTNPDASADTWASSMFGEGFRVLALGRLSHYKGFNMLIEALTDASGIRCIIAGDGEEADALKDQAMRSNAPVELCGHVSDAQAVGLMRAADVIVLPSMQRTEAFGLVLLEAMIAGKPVVASALSGSGMPWVVEQGGHGLLVPPGDSAGIRSALEQLRDDADLRSRLGQNGRHTFERLFHIASVENQIREVYETVLSQAAD